MQKEDRPRLRLRGFPLVLARSAALLVSLGVVTLVVAKAGVAGCKSSADIAADSHPPNSASDTAPGPGVSGSPGAAAGTATKPGEDPEVGFMGGSKAPAGGWAFPSKSATQAPAASTPAPNAPPQTPTQTPAQTPTKPPSKGGSTGALPPPPNAPNAPVDR